jgi:hypothetical protein
MATKKQRERAQRQAERLQAESLAAQLMSGSEAPLTPQTVAAVAPATTSQTVDVPNASASATGFERKPSNIAGVEVITGPNLEPVLVYKGTNNPVVGGTPAPTGNKVLGSTGDPEADLEIAFQEQIQKNVGALGAGNISSVTPAGPVALGRTSVYGGNEPPAPPTPPAEDAILTIAKQKLAEYGLDGIADSLKRARNEYPELEVNDLIFLVENDDRYNTPYKTRFKANELRFKQGLPRLKASEYLKLEQDFSRLFTTYNLPMFRNQQQYDKLIAGDVDIADATDRVVMAYDRVISDNTTRNAFRQFYGSLTDADIASALLDPEQQIPALERKVVAAEIGGQALRQGLGAQLRPVEAMVTDQGQQVSGYSNVQRGSLGAEALAGEGVTEAAAAAGYERVAEQLPTAEKLSAIYSGRAEQVSQRELEQAEILGLESAKRKQRQLAGMEEATFSGQAGTMRTSLGRRGRQGAF